MGNRNILLVTPRFPPEEGGAAQFYRLCSESLIDHPDISDVYVLTNTSGDVPLYERRKSTRVFRLFPSPAVTLIPWLPPLLRLKYLRRAVVNAIVLVATLFLSLTLRPAGIVYHTQSPYLGVQMAGTVTKSPLIATINDLGTSSLAVRFSDIVLAGSQNAQSHAEQITGSIPVVYQPFPVDRSELYNAVSDGRTGSTLPSSYALYVGDLVAYKGVDELLSWWTINGEETKFEELVLIGPDRSDGKYPRRIADIDGVRWLGRVPHNDTVSFLADASLFLLPSKREALPRTVLESIVLETPPVCPPGIPEFENQIAEFTLDNVSPENISDTVQRVANARVPEYNLANHEVAKTRNVILNACT